MSSIMRARSGLMDVLFIGVLLVLRRSWLAPSSSGQGTSHSLNRTYPLLVAASAGVLAAGYRVSGFVQWHMADALRRCSETVCYMGSYRRAQPVGANQFFRGTADGCQSAFQSGGTSRRRHFVAAGF